MLSIIQRKWHRSLVPLLVGMGITACGAQAPDISRLGEPLFDDQFEVSGALSGYTVNNERALSVRAQDGRYYAPVTENPDDITLHFNQKQGRIDAQKVSFPFVVVVRNIGIGLLNQTQTMPSAEGQPFIFAGVQVHVPDLEARTSSHVVVGHRGHHFNTVEGKNTVNGHSWVSDVGADKALDGRADLLIEGRSDRTLRVFWQPPNPDTETLPDRWQAYKGNGLLPGEAPPYTSEVYVGLITYAAGSTGLPFAGTADRFSIYKADSNK